MGQGTIWNLTDKRREDILDMLRRQYTVSGIACHYGVNPKTIFKVLREGKIDHRAVRMSGIANMRADVMQSVTEIVNPKDKVDAGMKFLSKYDLGDEVAEEVIVNSDDDIAAKILAELG